MFKDETTITFYLPGESKVSMKLYSITGSEVSEIFDSNQNMQPGVYDVKLNLSGTGLPAGMYLVNLIAGNAMQSIKLIYTPD